MYEVHYYKPEVEGVVKTNLTLEEAEQLQQKLTGDWYHAIICGLSFRVVETKGE